MIRIGIAGLIGYETALRLYEDHKEELDSRFSRRFINEFLKLKLLNCYEIDNTACTYYAAPIEKGGLWAALWKACEDLGFTGMEADLKDIEIKQEIIEICELFDENPYECPSSGAWVLVWDEDQQEKLKDNEQELIKNARIIGRITKNKKRVLLDGDKERFMTPPSRQEKDINDRKKRK